MHALYTFKINKNSVGLTNFLINVTRKVCQIGKRMSEMQLKINIKIHISILHLNTFLRKAFCILCKIFFEAYYLFVKYENTLLLPISNAQNKSFRPLIEGA